MHHCCHRDLAWGFIFDLAIHSAVHLNQMDKVMVVVETCCTVSLVLVCMHVCACVCVQVYV